MCDAVTLLAQDAMKQRNMQVDTVSLLSADLAASDASSGGNAPNIAAIAGGVAAAVAAIAAIVVTALLCRRRKAKLMGGVSMQNPTSQPQLEFKAKPFYEGYSKGANPAAGGSTADIEADAASASGMSAPSRYRMQGKQFDKVETSDGTSHDRALTTPFGLN